MKEYFERKKQYTLKSGVLDPSNRKCMNRRLDWRLIEQMGL
jgi:hypothetical protein